MKNLKEIDERYKNQPNGLGYLGWGGKSFYEINSDKPLYLNSYGGGKGFVLNNLSEVELFEFFETPHQYYLKNVELTEDEYYDILDVIDHDWELEEYIGLKLEHNNCRKWWGLTLDNYYLHPYYPDRKIVSFEVIRDIPFTKIGDILDVN